VRLSPYHEEEDVMKRQQEHTRENTPSDTKYNPATPSLRDSASLLREKEKQQVKKGYTSREGLIN
jgi:hypothetical protein